VIGASRAPFCRGLDAHDLTAGERYPRCPKAVAVDVATTAGRWLVRSQSSGAISDLPATRDEDLEPELGFCSVGSNRKRHARPIAGS
jgi:hypothetical protein